MFATRILSALVKLCFPAESRVPRASLVTTTRQIALPLLHGTALLFVLGATLCSVAAAQTANYVGALSTLPITPVLGSGIAVDRDGNIYICDESSNQVFKETLAGGVYTPSVVPVIGLVEPIAIAVDLGGSLYVADKTGNAVYRVFVSGAGYAQQTIGTGLNSPYGVAVDRGRNVYIADYGNRRVLKEAWHEGGSYVQSVLASETNNETYHPQGIAVDFNFNVYFTLISGGLVEKLTYSAGTYTQSTIVSGLERAEALAVDMPGNVYISDLLGNALYKAIPGASGYTLTTLDDQLTSPFGVALDESGNIYLNTSLTGDTTTNHTIEIMPSAGNFWMVNVGSAAASPVHELFSFSAAGTLGSIAVVTEGATPLDFTNPNTGTCAGGTAYIAGQTCTVDVGFTPSSPGSRVGAVELLATGQLLATGYVQGTGVGPLVAFLPGTQTSIGTSLSSPGGVAVDGGGNVYIGNSGASQVLMETLTGGNYVQSTIGAGFMSPGGLAVDGAGNVYVADFAANTVYEETLVGGTFVQSTVATGLNGPTGIAVDANGDVYIVNSGTQQVFMYTLWDGVYTQSTLGVGLVAPYGVALDGLGNVYISDPGAPAVYIEALSGGAYTQTSIGSGFQQPEGLAVDALGNVYISDAGLKQVLKETFSAGNYTQSVVPVTGLTSPAGLAVDGSGNLYIADYLGNQVLKEDYANATGFSFQSTPVGSTSSDSPQTVTLENIGNATLIFPVPASGANPSVPNNFLFNNSAVGACPLVPAGAAAGTLNAASSCLLPISFVPTAGGLLAGSLVLTDNNLNIPNATQSMSLSGSGIIVPATLSMPTPGTKLAGTNVTFSWTTGAGIAHYWFNLGTAASGANSKNLYSGGSITTTSINIGGLPTNNETLYATLYSYYSGAWQPIVYTYSASGNGPAVLLTPTSGTKLTASTVFTWTAGSGVTGYWLNIGTTASGANAKNVYTSGPITTLSKTVTGIPTYGSTLYVTLYSDILGVYQPTVYTYTEFGSPVAAVLTTPTPSTKLASASVTFTWSPGGGVTNYWFNVGTADSGTGAKNLYAGVSTTLTSVNVTGLPTNGETIYATLYSYIAGVWQPTVYTYTSSGSPTPAALISPAPNSTLGGASVTFTWSPGSGVTHYWFNLGTGTSSAAAKNIYAGASTTATSVTVSGIPTNGVTIYATLYSYINGAWQPTVYSFKAQ